MASTQVNIQDVVSTLEELDLVLEKFDDGQSILPTCCTYRQPRHSIKHVHVSDRYLDALASTCKPAALIGATIGSDNAPHTAKSNVQTATSTQSLVSDCVKSISTHAPSVSGLSTTADAISLISRANTSHTTCSKLDTRMNESKHCVSLNIADKQSPIVSSKLCTQQVNVSLPFSSQRDSCNISVKHKYVCSGISNEKSISNSRHLTNDELSDRYSDLNSRDKQKTSNNFDSAITVFERKTFLLNNISRKLHFHDSLTRKNDKEIVDVELLSVKERLKMFDSQNSISSCRLSRASKSNNSDNNRSNKNNSQNINLIALKDNEAYETQDLDKCIEKSNGLTSNDVCKLNFINDKLPNNQISEFLTNENCTINMSSTSKRSSIDTSQSCNSPMLVTFACSNSNNIHSTENCLKNEQATNTDCFLENPHSESNNLYCNLKQLSCISDIVQNGDSSASMISHSDKSLKNSFKQFGTIMNNDSTIVMNNSSGTSMTNVSYTITDVSSTIMNNDSTIVMNNISGTYMADGSDSMVDASSTSNNNDSVVLMTECSVNASLLRTSELIDGGKQNIKVVNSSSSLRDVDDAVPVTDTSFIYIKGDPISQIEPLKKPTKLKSFRIKSHDVRSFGSIENVNENENLQTINFANVNSLSNIDTEISSNSDINACGSFIYKLKTEQKTKSKNDCRHSSKQESQLSEISSCYGHSSSIEETNIFNYVTKPHAVNSNLMLATSSSYSTYKTQLTSSFAKRLNNCINTYSSTTSQNENKNLTVNDYNSVSKFTNSAFDSSKSRSHNSNIHRSEQFKKQPYSFDYINHKSSDTDANKLPRPSKYKFRHKFVNLIRKHQSTQMDVFSTNDDKNYNSNIFNKGRFSSHLNSRLSFSSNIATNSNSYFHSKSKPFVTEATDDFDYQKFTNSSQMFIDGKQYSEHRQVNCPFDEDAGLDKSYASESDSNIIYDMSSSVNSFEFVSHMDDQEARDEGICSLENQSSDTMKSILTASELASKFDSVRRLIRERQLKGIDSSPPRFTPPTPCRSPNNDHKMKSCAADNRNNRKKCEKNNRIIVSQPENNTKNALNKLPFTHQQTRKISASSNSSTELSSLTSSKKALRFTATVAPRPRYRDDQSDRFYTAPLKCDRLGVRPMTGVVRPNPLTHQNMDDCVCDSVSSSQQYNSLSSVLSQSPRKQTRSGQLGSLVYGRQYLSTAPTSSRLTAEHSADVQYHTIGGSHLTANVSKIPGEHFCRKKFNIFKGYWRRKH